MPTLHLLPTAAANGAMNMALDETLLQSALDNQRAALRFYTWTEPTLSLGYFQAHAQRTPGLAWVRRTTGGDAILHHHESTYCLALPAGPPWHTSESWLCRMHHIIAAALKQLGVATRSVVCGEEQRLGQYMCFQHQTPADLAINGHKVVGSAQRRPHGAMMQHGSILLRRSEHAPDLPGIAELTGITIAADRLIETSVAEFGKATRWDMKSIEWSPEDRKRADELYRDKYSAAEWNERR